MNRDMSWRPVPRGGPSGPSWPLLALIAVLLAINVAVFLYHGDPRRLLPRAKSAATHVGKAFKGPKPGALLPGAAHTCLARVAAWVLSDARAQSVEPPRAEAHPKSPKPQLVPVSPAEPLALPMAPMMGPPLPIDPLCDLRARGMVQRVQEGRLCDGGTPTRALLALGTSPEDTQSALAALARVIDFRRMQASDAFKARFDGAQRLLSLEFTRGLTEQVVVTRQDQAFVAEVQKVPIDTVVAEVTGEVKNSLWDAVIGAGEDPRLVAQLVDIFAYEVDFYSEVRQGDTFRLLVQKRYAHGQFLGYADVLAAELCCNNETHRAFLHKQNNRNDYFDANGHAMRKQLLRMPLAYGAITSRFGMRKHPVLGYTRAHNGTDYGVAEGTPAWSVGDGRVVRAGWVGGYGKLVEVAHPNGWLSQYAHLSKIIVRLGEHVRQKQVLGLSGQTGLATGPHLHYGLRHNNVYVNSLAQNFDRAEPLTGEALSLFKNEATTLLEEMGKMRMAQEPSRQPSSTVKTKG